MLKMFLVNVRESYLKSSSPCVSTCVKAFIENVDENIWCGKSNVKTYKSSETDLREFKIHCKGLLKSENLSMDKEKWGRGREVKTRGS